MECHVVACLGLQGTATACLEVCEDKEAQGFARERVGETSGGGAREA